MAVHYVAVVGPVYVKVAGGRVVAGLLKKNVGSVGAPSLVGFAEDGIQGFFKAFGSIKVGD